MMRSLLLIISLFISTCSLQAQTTTDTVDGSSKRLIRDGISFSLGFQFDYPLGSTYLNTSNKAIVGANLDLRYLFLKKIVLGVGYSSTYAKDFDRDVSGPLEKTNLFSTYGQIGYEHGLNELFQASAVFKIGEIQLKQTASNGKEFEEDGLLLGVGLGLDYKVYKNIHAFIQTEYRFDNLSIKAPESIQNRFNEIRMLSFMVGIKYKVR